MNDPRKAMGGQLRQVRVSRGLSRADLAALIEVHPSAVAQWELGMSAPRLPRMVKLRELLDDPTLYTESEAVA